MANKPLPMYKGCLTNPYMPVITSLILLFKAGDTPICFCAIILIMRLIPIRNAPINKTTIEGIAIGGPSVNGKTMGGNTKISKINILRRYRGILFSTCLIPNRANIRIAIT